MADIKRTIATMVAETRACPPGVQPLTRDEVNNLYDFKNRLVASLHRLYTKMPEEAADRVIARILREVVAELGHGD